MINLSVRDLLQQLYELDEQERIEAKTCSEVGKSVMETVCAFANEPGLDGGYLLLGIAPASDLPERYKIIGIANPGYSLKALEQLGEPGSRPRNPHIAAVLHETPFAETKGSGIRTMRNLMEAAGLTPPLFESDRSDDLFKATYLFHHFLSEEDIAWLANFKQLRLDDDEARALVFVRETGKITNFDYRSINKVDTLTASQRLGHLRDLGILLQRGKGPATFYLLFDYTIACITPDLFSHVSPEDQSQQRQEQSNNIDDVESAPRLYPESEALYPQRKALYPESEALYPFLQKMPQSLRDDVLQLSQRTTTERLRDLIIRLCRHREWQAEELSHLLKRDKSYLIKFYLRPLRREGVLKYTEKAYSAAKPEES